MALQSKTSKPAAGPVSTTKPALSTSRRTASEASAADAFLTELQRTADASPQTGRLSTLQAHANAASPSPAPVQRRQHGDRALKAFLSDNAKTSDEDQGEYVTRVTGKFKVDYPQHDRADVVHLRTIAWKSEGKGMEAYPAATPIALAGSFEAHVKGDQAGVGWHSEMSNKRNGDTYKYSDRGDIASSKGTYFAKSVKIAGTDKSGNSGRTTFFPPEMSMADIKYEAIYVANTFSKTGLVATGRGPRSGIMIDTLVNGNTIDSAYPHKPGW